MAKIKPARGKKPSQGPKNPGAVGCLILLVSVIALIGLLLYYSFVYSARPA